MRDGFLITMEPVWCSDSICWTYTFVDNVGLWMLIPVADFEHLCIVFLDFHILLEQRSGTNPFVNMVSFPDWGNSIPNFLII